MDGETACIDARDIGEVSHSMVLVDDLLDNGGLDLVVSTINGNVLLFETAGIYHPLRTWTAQVCTSAWISGISMSRFRSGEPSRWYLKLTMSEFSDQRKADLGEILEEIYSLFGSRSSITDRLKSDEGTTFRYC